MFGLFKKKTTPREFGYSIVHVALDPLSVDSGRSLGARFEDFDASQGSSNFLERKGISVETQKLHFRLFTHSAVQGASTQFDEPMRRQITEGAIGGFKSHPAGYEFIDTYRLLEEIYGGRHEFDERIQSLGNPSAQIHFLPNPHIGVLNAKYLLESFILPSMKNSGAFISDFRAYSSTISATVGLVQRAMNHLFGSLKLS